MTATLRSVPRDNRPEIQVGLDTEATTDQAIRELAKDPRVYQRGGQLVHVVATPGDAKQRSIFRPCGSPIIRTLEPPTVRERLSSRVRWTKYSKTADKHVGVLPPMDVISAIRSRGEWPSVRPLVGVVTSPVLRPDGSVLQEPGYDAATELLFAPSASYVPVQSEPSIDDAHVCLRSILALVKDFPFAKEHHRSAWLAGLFTLFSRPAIAGPVPLFAVDATTPGTGKSLLVEAAFRLAFGTEATRTIYPEDDDEMRKRITSHVLEGDPAVLIDNVTRPLGGASLDGALTSMTWKDRHLGSNATISGPHRIVWWATGNNLVAAGDLARRALSIRLEAKTERPEEREDFEQPHLVDHIMGVRHRLASFCLTILRAYACAGAPSCGGKLWGSFEGWSRLVAGCLRWLDMPDPMDARVSLDVDSNMDRLYHDALVSGLESLTRFTPEGLSARTIVETLYKYRDPAAPPDGHDSLRDALESICKVIPGKGPNVVWLGRALARLRGRIVGGRKLLGEVSPRTKIMLWRVVPSDAPASIAELSA